MPPLLVVSGDRAAAEGLLRAVQTRLSLPAWRSIDRWPGDHASGTLVAMGSGGGGGPLEDDSVFATDAQTRWHIAFDGVLFNRAEVVAMLGSRLRDPSGSDADIAAASVAVWGVDGAQLRWNGDWNLVVWDAVEQELWLSRDRFGSQSMYHATTPAGLFVASSHLMTFHPAGFRETDPAAMLFSNYLLETTGRTVLREVSAVPPGAHVVRRDSRAITVKRWWRTIDHLGGSMPTYDTAVPVVRELVLDAVDLRVPARGEFSTSLSGGLDSSIVAAAVNAALLARGDDPTRQVLHHQSYDGTSQDERRWAEAVALHLGLPFSDTAVTPEQALPFLECSIAAFEADHYMPLPLWWHYRMIAAAGLVRSFEGLGSGSLFADHRTLARDLRRGALQRGSLSAWGRWATHSMKAAGEERVSTVIAFLRSDLAEAFGSTALLGAVREQRAGASRRSAFLRQVSAWRQHECRASETAEAAQQVEALIALRHREIVQESRQLSPLNRILYLQTHMTQLPPDFRNFQALARSHGVKLLNPFTDWRVVVAAFELPDSAKLGEGWTKRILRDSFAPLLPQAVVRRRDKLGFTAPMLDWTARGLRTVMVQAAAAGLVSSSGEPDCALSESILAADVRDDVLALRRSWPLVQRSMLVTRFRNG